MIDHAEVDGVIFDVDGVLTDTARVHAAAWQAVFDDLLRRRGAAAGGEVEPFSDQDYLAYVDGKPRYDGARSFLESRGIELPAGDPDDPPGDATVCAVGNRKDRWFLDLILRDGVRAFPDAVDLVDRLASAGVPVAAVSASRNMVEVLRAAHVISRFAVLVDGVESERLQLPGKPDPAVFLEAARRLELDPARGTVVEDARAGVEAARAGGFGLVIGLARAGGVDRLHQHGAHVVVTSLAEVEVR